MPSNNKKSTASNVSLVTDPPAALALFGQVRWA